jgi:hypothetical protein
MGRTTLLGGIEVRDSCAAGWKRWATAAVLGRTTAALLGGREWDCWAGEGWETITLLGKRVVGDGGVAGWDIGCAAGWARIGLLGARRVGHGCPACWERITTLLGETGVRDSCAAGWKRWTTAAVLGRTTAALLGGRELDCWA